MVSEADVSESVAEAESVAVALLSESEAEPEAEAEAESVAEAEAVAVAEAESVAVADTEAESESELEFDAEFWQEASAFCVQAKPSSRQGSPEQAPRVRAVRMESAPKRPRERRGVEKFARMETTSKRRRRPP
jgi:hypothetical protein